MELSKILKQTGTTIIDVREPHEFELGFVAGAINISLYNLMDRLEDIRNLGAPVVLYCDTGNRGNQALLLLQSQGIQDVYNGGGIEDMEDLLAKARKATT